MYRLLTACITARHLLASAMADVTGPLSQETRNCDLIAFELPSCLDRHGSGRALLKMYTDLTDAGRQVVYFMQPSLRCRNVCKLMDRWNENEEKGEGRPFRFKEFCSCQMGDPVPGCRCMVECGRTMLGRRPPQGFFACQCPHCGKYDPQSETLSGCRLWTT